MPTDRIKKDRVLVDALTAYQTKDRDYWSFRGNAAREHTHAYFQYPAMMVPQMQGDLLEAALQAVPGIKHVLDPFVGSGTVLTEAMMRGLDFSGIDINPLAILLCRAKTIPFFDTALKERATELLVRIKYDRSCVIEAKFPNWQKWFRRDVAIELSKIHRAIVADGTLWARRFFWIALAETVRVSSNSRTSTFKLHIRKKDDAETRTINSVGIFTDVVKRNLTNLATAKAKLLEGGHLTRGRYSGATNVYLSDSGHANSSVKEADLLITSPPYGDNSTTIPYGQHSYLPLQWTALEDIDPKVDDQCLKTTHEIDSRSLGGSKRISSGTLNELKDRSETFAKTIAKLAAEPVDRTKRTLSFCRDLDRTLSPTLYHLKKHAYMIWIVGNRKVGGITIPLDTILTELLESRGAKKLAKITRLIPSKRMAIRNDFADTMARESILVLRNG